MKFFIISDPHFNHMNIATYCDRPTNFTELIIKRCQERVSMDDTVLCLGDVFMHKAEGWAAIHPQLPGKWVLIRGNHDRKRSCSWWMDNGFEFACDSMIFKGCWLTHEPAESLPFGCHLNIHGHLHNIWDGFHVDPVDNTHLIRKLKNPWQRLFAIEYTDYCPIEFDHFVSHPDRYKSRGPNAQS